MGLAGLSMFLDMTSVQNSSGDFSDKDVAKIKIDTTTPLGVVNAYYNYIGAHDLKDAYNLIDPMRQTEPFDHWTQGYATTLQTYLVSISVDAKNKNKINIKLESQDWINGKMVYQYFEGYWIVGKNLKLTGVSIQQVQNPPEEWFYTI